MRSLCNVKTCDTMPHRSPEDSQRLAGRIAGFTLLLLIASGLTGNFIGPDSLAGASDVAAAARNLLAHEQAFRVSLVCETIMFNCDVVLALALYALLKPVNASLALLGSFWRVANAIVLGVAVTASFAALRCLGASHDLAAFRPDQLYSLAALLFRVHDTASTIGLIFFCFGAAVHSYLLFRSAYIPKVLSGLYMFAAVQLLLSSFAFLIFPHLATLLGFSAFIPDLMAELSTALWLAFKGVNIPPQTGVSDVEASSGRKPASNPR